MPPALNFGTWIRSCKTKFLYLLNYNFSEKLIIIFLKILQLNIKNLTNKSKQSLANQFKLNLRIFSCFVSPFCLIKRRFFLDMTKAKMQIQLQYYKKKIFKAKKSKIWSLKYLGCSTRSAKVKKRPFLSLFFDDWYQPRS